MKQRLIDANELKEEFKSREDGHYYSTEPYLDYVLNEWKTRPVEHGGYDPVSVVNEAPTIEAIPIDWADEKVDKYFSETVKRGWEELKHLWEGYGPEGYAIWQRAKEKKNEID